MLTLVAFTSAALTGTKVRHGRLILSSVLSAGDAGHHAIRVDVGSSESVNAMFVDIKETCQRPATIVVHCAGVGPALCPFVSLEEESLDKGMCINLKVRYGLSLLLMNTALYSFRSTRRCAHVDKNQPLPHTIVVKAVDSHNM